MALDCFSTTMPVSSFFFRWLTMIRSCLKWPSMWLKKTVENPGVSSRVIKLWRAGAGIVMTMSPPAAGLDMLLVLTLELELLLGYLISIAKNRSAAAASCEHGERKSRCAQQEANLSHLKQAAIILDLYLLRILGFWEEPNVMKSGHHLEGVALHSGEVANLAGSVSMGSWHKSDRAERWNPRLL